MIFYIPGVNGLCKTQGTRQGGKLVSDNFNTDLIEVDNQNVDEQEKTIYQTALKFDEKTIVIGGDHSITFPIAKAFFENNKNENPGLIIFDAHADLMPPMKNPTHEEWLRATIEAGFPAENILLIGARNIDPEEIRYLKQKKIKTISVEEVKKNLGEVIKKIQDFSQDKLLYVSLDIDVFDSSVVSATGYPEKNGLTLEQGMSLLNKVSELNPQIFDLVEVNADKPGIDETVSLSVNILNNFLYPKKH